MQYVLSSKELTELAQEVMAAGDRLHMSATPADPPKHSHMAEIAAGILQERGIAWCDDE